MSRLATMTRTTIRQGAPSDFEAAMSAIPVDIWWHDEALCAQVDARLFFPLKGESAAPAVAICQDCPVREICLQDAMDKGERFGVRGGLTEQERRKLRGAR